MISNVFCFFGFVVLFCIVVIRVTADYHLTSVVNHHGYDMDKGHYTTFSRDSATGNWRMFDDVRVVPSSEEDILSSQAFLLVYSNSRNSSKNW